MDVLINTIQQIDREESEEEYDEILDNSFGANIGSRFGDQTRHTLAFH